MAVCSPLLALYQLELDKRCEIACNNSAMENISRQVFYSLHALFFFAFPLSYMIFSQKKMFLALRTTRIVPFQLSGSVEISNMRHKKAAKTLFALTIAFVFCWSPFMVIRTLMYFHLVEPGAIWRISQLLICLNAVSIRSNNVRYLWWKPQNKLAQRVLLSQLFRRLSSKQTSGRIS